MASWYEPEPPAALEVTPEQAWILGYEQREQELAEAEAAGLDVGPACSRLEGILRGLLVDPRPTDTEVMRLRGVQPFDQERR